MAELVDNVALAFKMCNQQRERIAELERQLAIADARALTLNADLGKMKDRLGSLEWQPITPQNLPKAGDEASGQDKMSLFANGSFRNLLRVVTDNSQTHTSEEWHRLGYHYFRAINLPTETEHAQRTPTDGGNHGGPDAGLR